MRAMYSSTIALLGLATGCSGNPSPPPPPCSAGCPAGQMCIIEVDGSIGCGVPDIYDEIRTEVHKFSGDAERPLPLAAVWCSGPSFEAYDFIFARHVPDYVSKKEGGAVSLDVQLAIIAGAHSKFALTPHHLLPTIDLSLPAGTNKSDDWVFKAYREDLFPPAHGRDPQTNTCIKPANNPQDPPCDEQELLETLMKNPLNTASQHGLPLTVQYVQPEDMLERQQLDEAFSAAARNALIHCEDFAAYKYKKHDACTISPFHANAGMQYNWLGEQLAKKNQLQKYQEWYPAPLSLIFLNNNEPATDENWLDAQASLQQPSFSTNFTLINLTPGSLYDPNASIKANFDQTWVNLYADMQQGFDAALIDIPASSADWVDAQKRHVAYTSAPLSFEDHRVNNYFKPDLHTYIGCCEGYPITYTDDNGVMVTIQCVDALPADIWQYGHSGLACFRTTNAPFPEQCTRANTQTNEQASQCKRPATPRASLNVDSLFDYNDVLYYSSDSNVYEPEQKRYHLIDNAWPISPNDAYKPANVDRIYRSWDGTSFTGGWPYNEKCASSSTCDPWTQFMTGEFLVKRGYTAVLLDQTDFNPQFWGETYSVALSDSVGRSLVDNGIAATLADPTYAFLNNDTRNWQRALGVSQLLLWMHRPRVVRNFDVCLGGNMKFDFTAPFLRADVDAVDKVWEDIDLKSFWKNSSLVENDEYTAIFQQRGVSKPLQNRFGREQKYWFLKTNMEAQTFVDWRTKHTFGESCTMDAECVSNHCMMDMASMVKKCACPSNTVCPENLDLNPEKPQTEVVAIARVQGGGASPLPKRYLIYAFTQQDTPVHSVKITVPGSTFNEVRIDGVEKHGTFCIVDDLPALRDVTCQRTFSIPVPEL